MDDIAPHFRLTFGAAANPDAVVQKGQARFTVLADRLIRMEWRPTGEFEDRASQAFWFRNQPVPPFTVSQHGDELRITTDCLTLHYLVGQPFVSDTLWIELTSPDVTWHYGDPDPRNLLGTARTLDGVDGATPLSLGLISRSGWSLVDDSYSLIFDADSWLQPRNPAAGQQDLYFMGYGHDYFAALRDFNRISGPVPMIPRWVLGNWWSRYWEYSHEELTGLMEEFQRRGIPLSVCIIDMDWHITKTGNASSGWTGYTWNRELFPDPDSTLRFLHDKGLKVALNLHPAAGIWPHEEAYEQMCAAIEQDPAEGEPVEFDIANPRFVDAYFRILHHPMEARGVDFWWMDWQQGQRSKVAGLDPLWWLNHLHFYDLGRSGDHRSFVFSRWGGLGNHRYPIGFSGDTVVTWESLAFQPYFTATASNVNYGWWSHDVGGHMSGIEDAELNARWVQFGTFLPVLRIHSTKNPYQDRRPWAYDAESYEIIREAMQLRHALIPYLYSMAWRYHHESIPPLLPMYYEHTEAEAAYHCPNQYMFGSQLLVAPFITPQDRETRLSRNVVWLPEGRWYNYFSGEHYEGDAWHAIYGGLRETPVFARGGAIVPEAPRVGWGGVDTPAHLVLRIFAGASGRFDLYDDEGNSNDYLQGSYAITPLTMDWSGGQARFSIEPAQGETRLIPAQRQYDLLFRGFHQPERVQVTINGRVVNVVSEYTAENHTLKIAGLAVSPTDRLEVTLTGKGGADLANRGDTRLQTCLKFLKAFRAESGVKEAIAHSLPDVIENPSLLGRYLTSLTDSQIRALLEVITGAGIEVTHSTGEMLVMAWNNRGDSHVTLNTALARQHEWWMYPERFPWSSGEMPRFQAFTPQGEFGMSNPWVIQANYYGFYTVKVENKV